MRTSFLSPILRSNNVSTRQQNEPSNDDIVDVYRFLHYLTDLNAFHRLVDTLGQDTDSSHSQFFSKCLSEINSKQIDIEFLRKIERQNNSANNTQQSCLSPLGKSVTFMNAVNNSIASAANSDLAWPLMFQEIDEINILSHFKFTFQLTTAPSFKFEEDDESSYDKENDTWNFSEIFNSLLSELPHFLLLGFSQEFGQSCMNLLHRNQENGKSVNKLVQYKDCITILIWLRTSIYFGLTDLFAENIIIGKKYFGY